MKLKNQITPISSLFLPNSHFDSQKNFLFIPPFGNHYSQGSYFMKAVMLLPQHYKYITFHILIIFILLTFFTKLQLQLKGTCKKCFPIKASPYLQNSNVIVLLQNKNQQKFSFFQTHWSIFSSSFLLFDKQKTAFLYFSGVQELKISHSCRKGYDKRCINGQYLYVN